MARWKAWAGVGVAAVGVALGVGWGAGRFGSSVSQSSAEPVEAASLATPASAAPQQPSLFTDVTPAVARNAPPAPDPAQSGARKRAAADVRRAVAAQRLARLDQRFEAQQQALEKAAPRQREPRDPSRPRPAVKPPGPDDVVIVRESPWNEPD